MVQNTRYLLPSIHHDLKEKMVFLGGARQVGKTTLAKKILEAKKSSHYLTWDDLDDRKIILINKIPTDACLVVLDEIHKYRLWRTIVKGYFDKYFPISNILVTGSARLDHFRKGGDSLVGRYHYLRLHPFTLPEISSRCEKDHLSTLLNFGGFPEPLFKQNARHLKRWQRERVSRVVTQDLHDLESVKDTSQIELLCELLYDRVASPLSIKSLSEDLSVSPHTVSHWIEILERLYFCYRISPYGTNRARAVKKTQKLYLWDWSQCTNTGAIFENLVAAHLLKYCHFYEDSHGDKMELRYLKDIDGKELDFIVIKNTQPLFALECKTGEKQLQKSVPFFQNKFKIPKVYQVHLGTQDFGNAAKGGRIIPFDKFCLEEKML
jgi:predicted AAA+ superfamily ATPase